MQIMQLPSSLSVVAMWQWLAKSDVLTASLVLQPYLPLNFLRNRCIHRADVEN